MASDQRDALLSILEGSRQIGGRFTAIRRIGDGGGGSFSALVSADDSQTDARVALKFCLPILQQNDPYRFESFKREERLLARFVGKPDIVRLVAPRAEHVEVLKTADGLEVPLTFTYFGLELAVTDLGTIVASGGWEAVRTLTAFRAVCRGVQRLHSASTVHRDLKPGNILVMKDGTIRLSDLGTARSFDGSDEGLLQQYQFPPGDLRYTAPEMLACLHDVDPRVAFRADFFSLGATLFELFTGVVLGLHLFDARFQADLLQAMVATRRADRKRVFDLLIPTVANSHRLPSIRSFGARVPACIRDRIDSLYRALAGIDYRTRLCEFERVFHQIDVCLLILTNEDSYRRWLETKRQRRTTAAVCEVRK